MSALPIQIAVNLMEYWIIILLIQHVCAGYINLCKRNRGLCCVISVLGTILAALHSGSVSFLVSMVVEIALTVLLFSKKRVSDLLRFFPAFAIYFALTVAPEGILDELVPAAHIELAFHGYATTFISLATDVVLLAVLMILRYLLIKYQTTVHFSAKEILGSIALLFFSFIDGQLIVLLNRSYHKPLYYYTYVFIFVGGFICGLGYFLYSLIESRVRMYRQSVARNEMEYLKLQLDALQEGKENQEHVAKLRHDLNKHFAVIASLCEEGDYEAVRKYTEQLSHEVVGRGKLLTGNQVADMVVASKRKLCEENGIDFSFSGSMQNLNVMAGPDICGLLANAYDNAIEACRRCSGAYIHTQVSTTCNYTVIQIDNSVEKKIPVLNNSVATTKGDKKSHGYGIAIMKQIAQKYKGSCTFYCDEREFRVKIVLLT